MKLLLVEDERRTAQLLRELILKLHPSYEILAISDSIEASVNILRELPVAPDLIFMDIELSDGLSFEIFRQTEVQSPVIFCTAHDHYALQAFQNHGIAYLLKPFSEEDIRAALAQHLQLQRFFASTGSLVQQALEELSPASPSKDQFLVHFRDRLIPVSLRNIVAFVRQDQLVLLYHRDGRSFSVPQSLDELGDLLPDSTFFRINRRMMVQRTWVKEITNYPNRKISLTLEVAVPEPAIVSRLKVSQFLRWMEGES
ncbi:MAG: LytTR family DNA-binding domain-containing protein [Bacteroidia bacterium]|nr:LytTR family DNA-binding domain-containing protein [Bacteroidia bacterium]